MSIGPRIGPRVGFGGLRFGSGFSTAADPFAGVSKDATSNIYVPANAAEWTTFIAAAGLSIAVPDALWLFQEASGNPADSIGSFTLTASGTGISYQQAVTGWSRKAIKFTDAGTGALVSTSTSLPDISTTSMLTVAYCDILSTPASARDIVTQGTTTRDALQVTTTPRFQALSGSNASPQNGTPVGAVRPYTLRTNRSASTVLGTTDIHKAVPTFSTSITGKKITFGNLASGSPPLTCLYSFELHGVNAELSDATLKSLLQALGWTITWS